LPVGYFPLILDLHFPLSMDAPRQIMKALGKVSDTF
jgi:hypothetical protein